MQKRNQRRLGTDHKESNKRSKRKFILLEVSLMPNPFFQSKIESYTQNGLSIIVINV